MASTRRTGYPLFHEAHEFIFGVQPHGAETNLPCEAGCDGGLQKNALAAGNIRCCAPDVLASAFTRRDGENANARSAKSGSMNAGLPAEDVGVEFSGNGTRIVLRSLDWHCPAVGLQETENALAVVAKFQRKDPVRNDAELFLSRTRHRPLKRRTLIARRRGEWDFVLDEQAHIAALPARQLQRRDDVGDHQRVLKEQALHAAVARSPIESGELRIVHATKVRGPAATESIGNTP